MDILRQINSEQILVYGTVLIICTLIIYLYLRKKNIQSKDIEEKVTKAKEEGLFEPISLHPYIDLNVCIGSAACVSDCPEKDILGIVKSKATLIKSTNCVGHGACFHACPVEAISLRIGTEKRGIDLPHVNQNFETNTEGIYIAGELGGMGLIKNAVEQGHQAIKSIVKNKKTTTENVYDVIIIGAGPAGISASLAAKKYGLSSLTLDQDSLGGTINSFPRAKVVMTSPMDLPLFGKVKLYDTSKQELLNLWNKVITEQKLEIIENTKVEEITPTNDNTFKIRTNNHKEFVCNNVLLTIGRRGSPRKLGIPGEDNAKVAYRLLEPERISKKQIIIVGGGDSAIESALLLKDTNEVLLSYRKENFSRLKPKNKEKIEAAKNDGSIDVLFSSNLIDIKDKEVLIKVDDYEELQHIKNDLVYIFAGGELPTKFLQKAGIKITKRFGYIIKKHN